MKIPILEIFAIFTLCAAALWLTMSISSLLQPGKRVKQKRERLIEKIVHSFEDHPLATAVICTITIAIIITGGTK